MATQSLYRRYRPRRFSELKGQDHIVRALRTSVAEGREGQAYLFSGPRGTGKTTTARIMAKVLNCQNPADGEPCCECESCRSVEAGTSYDVHELDAASNNGVDAMRDLIEKASLGTPGRHKVYILDEVHMLSKGAEAALLKTLEEPPPHVVFVLATTDPQKMSDTIRSRTQHLQFHLLAPDTLQEHVRWVAEDAGLTVTDEAVEQVVAQGAGSPRDTLSFLELASNAGGDAAEVIELDEFVESMIDDDPGRALKMVAHAISRGRDPRTITEELIAFFRNGFLALMAPDLVQLPSQRIEAMTDLAQRLGAPGLVRGIETLGEALTEMRQAPDPRVLLDVATVQLTSPQVGEADVAGLAARIQKLERKVADGVPAVAAPTAATSATTAAASAPAPTVGPAPPAVDPATGRAKLGSRLGGSAPASSAAAETPEAKTPPETPPEAPVESSDPPARIPERPASETPGSSAPAPEHAPSAPTPAPAAAAGGQVSAADWDAVRPQLRGMARAVYSPATHVSSAPGSVTLAAPNEAHRAKCEQHREAVEQALGAHAGAAVTVELVVDGGGGGGGGGGAAPSPSAPSSASSSPASSPGPVSEPDPSARAGAAPPETAHESASETASASARRAAESSATATSGALAHDSHPVAESSPDAARLTVVPTVDEDRGDPPAAASPTEAPTEAPSGAADEPVETMSAVDGRAIAEEARHRGPDPDPEAGLQQLADTLPDDDEVDLDDLVDAPPETVKTPIDRLAEAFPGSELVDDQY